MYQVFLINEFGEEKTVEFQHYAYRNLMELILNECYEEWGDCLGRAMCGTCHIEIISGSTDDEMENFEAQTLDGLPNKTANSRLACQISLDESIHKMKFRILKDF